MFPASKHFPSTSTHKPTDSLPNCRNNIFRESNPPEISTSEKKIVSPFNLKPTCCFFLCGKIWLGTHELVTRFLCTLQLFSPFSLHFFQLKPFPSPTFQVVCVEAKELREMNENLYHGHGIVAECTVT